MRTERSNRFPKGYDDPEVAVRTQFSLAEAYLEMAKRHRKLGETELARQEFASAKQLLNSSLDQFHAPETRSHAEYLLGNLTLEEALAATTPETKDTRFRAALARFMNVTGTYPDTLHASKAQFKVATIYEALKEPDIAAQEYVKLAYKHPDSEYLATSMARLGSHFLKKAASYESKAKPLLASGEAGDKDAAFEGAAMEKMAHKEYYKTAKIFERLLERFPTTPSQVKRDCVADKPTCDPGRPKKLSMPSWQLPMRKASTRRSALPPCTGLACVTKTSAMSCPRTPFTND